MRGIYKIAIDSATITKQVGLTDEQEQYLEDNWHSVVGAVLEHIMLDVIPNETKYQINIGLELEKYQ